MRSCLRSVLRLVLSGLAVVAHHGASAQSIERNPGQNCSSVLQKMRADFAVEPGRLLLAMEDALATSEPCVCAIVRTAVDLAGREPELTIQILIAALRLLPASAARISECILQEAPAAGPALRAALAQELGEKAGDLLIGQVPLSPAEEPTEVGIEKSPLGKQALPVHNVEPTGESEKLAEIFPTIAISGIYIVLRAGTPSSAPPWSVPFQVVHPIVYTTKRSPFRPLLPVTPSTPE